ncbi:hypothetical protein HNQ60_004209 [Povalibacter uvarum]|uniref:Peptidase M3A/M3B catalytic domain-containing protein n=1 Tax=Povalibacter uvarum TaxID=732238 RepID=A0A841HSN6_9GAMM|nr:M3 family metallopeptidase [Povalibacter uvarum]MBB6095319.1 hypothetical protein [Povalibacter uvarum]
MNEGIAGRTNRLATVSLFGLLLLGATGSAGDRSLDAAEQAYADMNDAYGAMSLIDSGLQSTWEGRDRAQWLERYSAKRAAVLASLQKIPADRLAGVDARAAQVMREAIDAAGSSPDSMAPTARCSDAQRRDLAPDALRQSLYGCFAELANSLRFENGLVTRVGAFDLLTRMEEPARRKALFFAFVPLWQSLNGNSEPQSPYRRMIAATSAAMSPEDSPINAAARTVGADAARIERWLEQILDTWRRVTDDEPIEPWDYRFVHGAAERELGPAIAREAMQPINERFYLDLGADLKRWGVLYDLDPRTGKAPLAYTDYVRRGREANGAWQPTLVRISGNYAHGGLGLLNELVHENGHAVHMMALRTRPAFMDLGDAVFYEAFADVPSWSVYEPAWQQKYLGVSATQERSLRSLYATVMLDVAWGLFDLRMLREPQRNPNEVWTEITHRYLHIVPHPELSWWAVRVQLVDSPGYMINYGLGSVITADIRKQITQNLGSVDAGNARWYPWLAEKVLASGQTQETSQLLRDFLGRPVSPQALLEQLERLRVPSN